MVNREKYIGVNDEWDKPDAGSREIKMVSRSGWVRVHSPSWSWSSSCGSKWPPALFFLCSVVQSLWPWPPPSSHDVAAPTYAPLPHCSCPLSSLLPCALQSSSTMSFQFHLCMTTRNLGMESGIQCLFCFPLVSWSSPSSASPLMCHVI